MERPLGAIEEAMKIELVEGGTLPQRMTDGSVGYDCFAREVDLHFPCNPEWARKEGWVAKPKSATIKLGFRIDCNHPYTHSVGDKSTGFYYHSDMNYGAFLFPRSGWAREYGFRLKNTIGVIDPDYRGEVIAEVEFNDCPPDIIEYFNNCMKFLEDGSYEEGYSPEQPRICQLVFLPCYVGELTQVDKLEETERGEGGFGSTNE